MALKLGSGVLTTRVAGSKYVTVYLEASNREVFMKECVLQRYWNECYVSSLNLPIFLYLSIASFRVYILIVLTFLFFQSCSLLLLSYFLSSILLSFFLFASQRDMIVAFIFATRCL